MVEHWSLSLDGHGLDDKPGGGLMNRLSAVFAAVVFLSSGTGAGPAWSQILNMEPTRYYFQQMGQLVGTLESCRKHFCVAISDAQPQLGQMCVAVEDPLAGLIFEELRSCGPSDGQLNELRQIFRTSVATYKHFACPLSRDEARTKYRVIEDTIKERKHLGISCTRR